jgi:hypothetical protein
LFDIVIARLSPLGCHAGAEAIPSNLGSFNDLSLINGYLMKTSDLPLIKET